MGNKGGDLDARNEISGMSLRDIQNVQQSWTPIYANASGHGFLILSRLFKADPEAKTLFKEQLAEKESDASVYFRAHIINLMSAINESVQHLDKPELVVVWMNKFGTKHDHLHVQKKHFWVLKDVLVNILQNDLKLKANVIQSWDRYLSFIYGHLLSKLSS